jgi:ribosome-associated translation inhibitor RaiA
MPIPLGVAYVRCSTDSGLHLGHSSKFSRMRERRMQVLLNTDPHTDGRQSIAEYLEATVTEALGHYGERIIRVEAHLSDANSAAKANTDEIHCTMQARVVGLDPVVVRERASTAHQAIHGAVGKLERALSSALGKHDQRPNTRYE